MSARDSMVTRVLSVFLPVIFISFHAQGSSIVESEFELFLSKNFQQSLIDQKWKTLMAEKFNLNWQIPDQSVSAQDVDVQLSGITMDVSSQLQKPTLVEGSTQLDVSSKDLTVNVHISKIFVDQIVERNMGGIIGRFRIKADCSDVQFKLVPGKGSFTLRLSPKVEGSITGGTVTDAQLDWEKDSLQPVGEISCAGVEGFADLIQKEVKKVADNSDLFFAPQKAGLIEYLNNSIGSYNLNLGEQRQIATSRPDIKASMQVNEYLDRGENGAVVKGIVSIEFLKAPNKAKQTLRLSDEVVSDSGNGLIRLPAEFVKVVVKEAFAAGTWVEEVMSDKIPGFSSLMSSRLSQFFVWPELMRFSKSTKFLFKLYSNKDIDVTGGAGLSYNVNGTLWAQMNSPRSGKYIPFMYFGMPLKSQVKLSVKNSEVVAKFVSPSLTLNYYWDNNYMNKYGKYDEFASSTIRSKILSALTGESMSMKIPGIPLLEGLHLQVKSLEAPAQSQSIRIILGVNP